jgi:glutamyl-tRNA synthetase
MRELPLDEYVQVVARHLGREPDDRLRAACEIVQEKAQTLAEVWPLIGFLFGPPVENEKAWRKTMVDGSVDLLRAARAALAGAEGFDSAAIEAALSPLPEQLGVKPGRVYQPIRVAISGGTVSPGIFESLAVLGREESLQRIDAAILQLLS